MYLHTHTQLPSPNPDVFSKCSWKQEYSLTKKSEQIECQGRQVDYTRYSAPTISHMHTLATHRDNWSNTFQVLVPEMSKVHSCGLASNGSRIDILKLFCFPHTTVVTGASLCKLSRTVPKLLHLDSVLHIVPSVQAPFHFYPPRSGGRPHPEQEPLL